MAAVLRSTLVAKVRSRGHFEHLTHITDAQIAQHLDTAYRRLRAKKDAARGHERELRTAFAHVEPGDRLILLPEDFDQLRGLLLQKATYVAVEA